MHTFISRALRCGGLIAAGSTSLALAADGDYRNHAALTESVRALDDEFDACASDVIGASREGRGVFILTLSGDPDTADQRPALLITAGLDGRHLVGTETALRVARNLLTEHGELLESMTVYILPRINPDGTELNLGAVNAGQVGTITVVDADRDGIADEDGPDDLNGDGLITQMRRLDPPLDDEATHMADPAEPRLLKKPDSTKGERATYSLYVEGLDDDGDGLIAEDGVGFVDLEKNFMHLWPEFDRDSGAYPASEPESLALVKFVLAHRNIVAAITYGRHDTLVNPPDGKGKDVSGRGPKNIDAGDVSLYKEISRIYKEATDQTNAAGEDGAGSFHAWLYAQRGIPSFATTVWGRPGEAKKAKAGPDAAGDDDAAGAAGSWTGSIDIPDMGTLDYTLDVTGSSGPVTADFTTPMFSIALQGTFDENTGALSLSGDAGPEQTVSITGNVSGNSMTGSATGPDGSSVTINAKRQGGAPAPAQGGGGSDANSDKPADAEAAAWLKYSDEQRDGAGFVQWEPFEHPTLGAVEIGGFVPGFRMNPPPSALDELAEAQTKFVMELMDRRPELTVQGPDVTKLAAGLYEVRFGIVNDGYLPTTTAMARKARSVLPTVVRLSVPVEQIVAGDRVSRSWGIDGSGGRFVLHWILRVADGSEVAIDIINQQLGDQTITFTAQ